MPPAACSLHLEYRVFPWRGEYWESPGRFSTPTASPFLTRRSSSPGIFISGLVRRRLTPAAQVSLRTSRYISGARPIFKVVINISASSGGNTVRTLLSPFARAQAVSLPQRCRSGDGEGNTRQRRNAGVLSFLRKHVSARLALIWLVVVIPLSVVLLATFYALYQSQLSLAEQVRQGYAQSVATSFNLLLTEMRLTMRSTGTEIGDAGASSASATPELVRLASSYPVAYAALADASGRVVASSKRALVGSSVATDTAFRAAMRAKNGGGLEPSEVASPGLVGFHVAQAIPARAGRPSRVMLMFVDARKLHDSFPVMVPTGGVSVVDSAGQVVFQNEDVRLALKRAQWGAAFPFVQQALHGEVGKTRGWRFPLGGTRIGVFVPIERIGWAAGSSVNPAVALAPFYRILAIGFPPALLIGVLALIVAIMTARGIRRPLDALSEEADRIGSGKLEEPVRVEREDEIGAVAQSLDTARTELLEARRRAEQELETTQVLLTSADALAASLDLDAVFATVARVLARVSGHSRVTVDLLDSVSNQIEVVHILGDPRMKAGTQLPARLIPPQLQPQLETGRPIVVDIEALPLTEEDASFFKDLAVRYALAVPLVVSGKVIGLVGIDEPGERREFDERTLRIAEGIAPEAALAIENARLFEAERAAERRASHERDRIESVLEEQKRLAEELDTQQKQLQAVLDNMAEGVIVLHPDGSVEVNEAYAGIHGFATKDEALTRLSEYGGSTVLDVDGHLCSDSDWPAGRLLRGEKFANVLYEIRVAATGRRFVAAYGGVPIVDRDGKFLMGVLTIHDVTELHDARRFGRSMVEISNQLASSPDIDETLPTVFERACRELRA